jgi:iron(III) transport system ATP-binding protein
VARIELDRVSKGFGGKVAAVHELSLEVEDREFVTLLGPSGCGKTTTLRMLAGFIKPDAGSIAVGGRVLSSSEGVVPPERRRMGMVFQNYAIWPHKTVFENVAFGLRVQRRSKKEIGERVGAMLEVVGLTGMEGRYPNQLSGGQQQRVALARSLVVEPDILLLDEPLSNLDAKLRERVRWELKQLQRRLQITFVYVTHDQAEALALSDRIAVLHQGRLQQYGPPRDVYTRPANRLVADFMGTVNLVPGTAVPGADGGVELAAGRVTGVPLPASLPAGGPVLLAVRPENIRLAPADGDPSDAFPGRVGEATFLGNTADYVVQIEGAQLRVQTHPTEIFRVGDPVVVRLDGPHCTVVPEGE